MTGVSWILTAVFLLSAVPVVGDVLHPLLEPVRFKQDMLASQGASAAKEYAASKFSLQLKTIVRRHLNEKLPDLVEVKAVARATIPGSLLENRRLLAFLDDAEHKVIYDSGFFEPECESEDQAFGDVETVTLDDHILWSIQIVSYKEACCGASREEEKKSLFFDANQSFKQVLELNDSHVYFGVADCADPKKEAAHQLMILSWLHPNGGGPDSSSWIERSEWTYQGPKWQLKSEKEQIIDWNKDKSRLQIAPRK